MVRALERADLLPLTPSDDESVDFSGPDGQERLFDLLQIETQAVDLEDLFHEVLVFFGHIHSTNPRHGALGGIGYKRPSTDDLILRRSIPTSTRSVFERSPIIFLMGEGSLRTSVGMARI